MNLTRTPLSGPTAGGDSSSSQGFGIFGLAGVIVLFLFVLYPGVLLGTHSFFDRDFGVFTYPVAYHAHQSFWRGEVPLWNPLNDTGVPFLAQWNTTVCYPLSLVYLALPLPWSLNCFCLLHLILAGVGMHWLVLEWTDNRLAANVAGVAFALNGLMLNSLIWTSNLAALAWTPIVLLLAEKALRLGGTRRVVIAGFAGALQMLAGAPEAIVFTWILVATLWLGQVLSRRLPLVASLRRFLLLVTLVAGLSAVQLLPFLDLLRHAQRDTSYSISDAWPMPIWGWASYLVPELHCSHTALGSETQNGQSWTSSYYLGGGIVALALVGALDRSNRRAWWAAGAAGVGLVLALGREGLLYAWLKSAIPWIGFARYPIKFVLLPTFALPLLAAFGLCRLQSNNRDDARRSDRSFKVITLLCLVATVLILGAAYHWPQLGDSWAATWQSGLYRMLFLGAVLAALVALRSFHDTGRRRLLQFALVAIVGLDLITAGLHLQPTVSTRAFGPVELNMSFRPKYGETRAMLSAAARAFLGNADQPDPLYYCVGVRGALFDNCNLPETIPKLDGFFSLHLREESEMLRILYARPDAVPARLCEFLGVAQITAPDSVFAWQTRTGALPLVTAGQQPVFIEDADALRSLERDDWDPQHIVYLPPSARDQAGSVRGGGVKISELEPAAHEIRFSVEADEPAIVVLAQTHFHNWRAEVDGREVPLWRANYAYQALLVPAGRHPVVLRYRDSTFYTGLIVSTITCLAGLALAWRREKRGGSPYSPAGAGLAEHRVP